VWQQERGCRAWPEGSHRHGRFIGEVLSPVPKVPREETVDLVRQVAEARIKNVWVHTNRDTPQAVDVAKERGLNVLTGTCAVMYVKRGFS